MIVLRLKHKPILRPWSDGVSRCISQLKILHKRFLDETREPLFRDLAEEVYLSDAYPSEEKQALKAIGVGLVSYNDIFERVKADLESPSSKTKNLQTSQTWHTRSAQMMLDAARKPLHFESLCALKMLPLRDGSWTSIAVGEVYYHEVGGVDVPQDLGLRLLAPEFLSNPTRRELFERLGVKSCDPMAVKELIIRKYNTWNNVDLDSSVSHIRFLFCHCPKEEEILHKTVFLFDAHERPIYRVHVTFGHDMIVDDLYFDSDGTYDVRKLCAQQRGFNGRSTERVVHIIHPAYMKFDAPISPPHNLSWSAWLQKNAKILDSPRLVNKRNPLKPSDLFLWIIENRIDSVLGLLKTHWHTYQKLMSPEIVDLLQGFEFECINGYACLKDTLVPLPELVNTAKDLKVHDEMRFLTLPPEFELESVEDWLFLKMLGAGVAVDLKFYLEALRALMCTIPFPEDKKPEEEDSTRSVVLRVYAAIEGRSQVEDYEYLQ